METTDQNISNILKNYFQPLTPQVVEDDEKITEYLKALNYAIDQANIKNIALTGSYGSGKSSILKTLEYRHPEHYYLRISLASFNDPEFPDPKSSDTAKTQSETSPQIEEPVTKLGPHTPRPTGIDAMENLERLLELSILQQIFYHVEHDKIPDSRFKRIISLGSDTILNFQITAIIWILSGWYLFFPNSLDFQLVTYFNSDLIKIIALILFLVGLAKLLSHFRRVYNNSKVNKLNIQSGEVEVDREIDQSILNKHIDEIIYFFEVTPYNVVFIEDLDRFNNTAIFSKLREINLLINNSKQINRTINFIYAVRDDIFEDSHRIKFFDFFIPVIPVSDPSNATDLLTKSFKKLQPPVPNDDFLSDVASFIPDMRFLNNVFNEYLLYQKNIEAPLLPEKRFAIILYKNLYPKDFIQLQKGKGNLSSILRTRNSLVQKLTLKLSGEITATENKLTAVKKDLVLQENELRAVYINSIQNSVGNSVAVKISGGFKSFQALKDEKFFDQIRKENAIVHRGATNLNSYNTSFTEHEGKSFKSIEQEVNPDLTYEERVNQIRNKTTENTLLRQLSQLKKELNRLRHLNLGQLLSQVNDLEDFGEFKGDKLIIYLLKKGYIDENYVSYISYFYEGQITITDHEFYQNVMAGISNPFDYQLMRTSNLIRKLAPRFFTKEAIFNLNLVDQLIQNKNKFQTKYELFFQKVSDQSPQSNDFILHYADKGKYPGIFLAEVYRLWPMLWEFFSQQVDFEKKQLDQYLFLLLKQVETETLLESIEKNGIVTYLKEDPQILNLLQKLPKKKVQQLISDTPIEFSNLVYSEKNEIQALLRYIIKNGYWQFTDALALTICQLYKDPSITTANVQAQPFTLLSSIEEISDLIDKDIHHFTKELLLDKQILKESQGALVDLLNHSDVLKEYKERIIELQDRSLKINRLKGITDSKVQQLLLTHGMVKATWNNVLEYFKEQVKIDEALGSFLNDFAELLILDEAELSNVQAFKEQLIVYNDLKLESYKELIRFFFKKPYRPENFESLSRKKVSFLIENETLIFDPEVFKYLREHFDGLQIQLVENHPKKFLQKLQELILNTEDLNQLTLSENLNDDLKYQVISNYSEKIPEMNKEASQCLVKIFLKHPTLGLQATPIHHLIQATLDDHEAIRLLVKYEEELSDDNIRKAIQMLPYRFHKILKKRKRLELNRINTYIELGELLERHQIATLKIKSDTIIITGSYK